MPEADNSLVLLVGASGRVGQMVCHHWRKIPGRLSLVTQFRSASDEQESLIWNPLSGSRISSGSATENRGFRAMIMLAGAVPGSKDLDINQALAEACLEASAAEGISRVLIASSSAVYGAGTALTENSPCVPINEYGAAKLRMEHACEPWRKKGMDLCLLRIGNVAGADALLQNVAKTMPGERIEIDIYDDGRGPVRSYIGVRTLAEVLRSLCSHPLPLPPILNVGTPQPVSMEALANAAGQLWKGRAVARTSTQNITLDCSLLASMHSFTPQDSYPTEMVDQWRESAKK